MFLTLLSARRALVGVSLAVAATMSTFAASAHQPPSNTAAAATDTGTLAAMACPTWGPSAFGDSWGDARSGGRRHQGVDMVADRGLPVVAALAGFAEFKLTSAGGNSIWLTTADGDKFFYAHLDAWEGASRDVAQGEVLGYVGSTGNANGPHLHFEVHPGGEPSNPYPYTAEACTPPSPEIPLQESSRSEIPRLAMR